MCAKEKVRTRGSLDEGAVGRENKVVVKPRRSGYHRRQGREIFADHPRQR